MTYCYTTLNQPLRQTAKQRQSSLIAESKFNNRNPLQDRTRDLQAKMSCFSANIMMNRMMMKSKNFNNLNTIPEYANSMYEVVLKQRAVA